MRGSDNAFDLVLEVGNGACCRVGHMVDATEDDLCDGAPDLSIMPSQRSGGLLHRTREAPVGVKLCFLECKRPPNG